MFAAEPLVKLFVFTSTVVPGAKLVGLTVTVIVVAAFAGVTVSGRAIVATSIAIRAYIVYLMVLFLLSIYFSPFFRVGYNICEWYIRGWIGLAKPRFIQVFSPCF